MNKILVALVCIFLIGGAVAIFIYSSYEKPLEQKGIQHANVTLMAFDPATNQPVATGYVVTLDGSSQATTQGQTLTAGRVFFQIPLNHSFTVYNANLEGQSFYISNMSGFTPDTNPIRIDFPLTQEGNLTLSESGTLGTDNPLSLIITAQGTVRDIGFCLRWSTHFVTASSPSFNEMDIPKRLTNKADRCYSTGQSLKDNSITIPISYQTFGNLDSTDGINVTVLDGDSRYYQPNNGFIFEEQNGTDTGIADTSYAISPDDTNRA